MKYIDIEGNPILKDTVYSDKKHHYLLGQANPPLFIRDDGELVSLDPDYTHSFLVRQEISEIPEKVTHLRNQISFLERYLAQRQPKCIEDNGIFEELKHLQSLTSRSKSCSGQWTSMDGEMPSLAKERDL